MPEGFDIWKLLAGLGIFMFGMYFIEDSLKNLAGRGFKKFLKEQTTNPLKGILSGTLVTAILQSSSVVTLMVLAFVGAGILELRNAIGIIFGSNLGTTFTGWIVTSLGFKADIESFALPFIAFGGLALVIFPARQKAWEGGRFLLGFGFLFMGLDFMKTSIGDLASQVDLSLFQGWSPFLFFPIGFVLTAIIQSSSAAMIITLSALNTGIIGLEAAAAMVVGNDLGTTITVLLGGLKGTAAKKRVALSHFLFNIVTDLVALMVLYPLLYLLTELIGMKDPLFTLVAFHSSFNLLGIILMFPFIGMFARFLKKRYSSDNEQVSQYITKVSTNVPEAAIEVLRKDIIHLIGRVFYLNLTALNIDTGLFALGNGRKNGEGVFKTDNYAKDYATVKQLEGELVEYYLQIQNEKLEGEEASTISRYIHAVRNAMVSTKDIKDIQHNVKEFESSSNDAKRGLYLFLKGQLNEFYLTLYEEYRSDNEAAHFERLADLLQENHKIYERMLKTIYQQIASKTLDEIEISTLLNVNREIYDANRALILAIKDVVLGSEKAESFNTIPLSK